MYKKDFKNSVAWLLRAINKNPLNDSNRYLLAKVLIKYNKFNRAKSNLNKAMDLDPAKIEYRVAYSDILYEIDGSDTAIGYLYDILTDFPDNPKLLSQIGIFFYRSGQLKSFENIKEKLHELPTKDTTLYEFLIEAAKLDDKENDEIKYSRKLIELNPGDLNTRLNLGKLYMRQEKYKNALIEFKAIEDRLNTYPSLQLYMSKLYLLTDNKDKAVELANKEVKANASSEFGYILLGDIYTAKKEYLKAEKYYKKAQKIDGDNVDMLLGLAKISFKKSQYDLTIDLFLKARDLSPERSEIHKLLGDTYRKTGQSSLGIESYKLFLELSPTSKYKDEIRTYIRKME
jgi:tetratricopeptide (TPR) repeat protein